MHGRAALRRLLAVPEAAVRLLLRTFQYRLKMLCTGAFGILCLTVALGVAMLPFIGLIMPDALIPIGWIDEDKTDYSQRLLDGVNALMWFGCSAMMKTTDRQSADRPA